MGTVVSGTFSDRAAAQEAVERLRAAGVSTADISLIMQDPGPRAEPPIAEAPERAEVMSVPAEDPSPAASGTVKGAERMSHLPRQPLVGE